MREKREKKKDKDQKRKEAQEKIKQKGKAKHRGQRNIRNWLLVRRGGESKKED